MNEQLFLIIADTVPILSSQNCNKYTTMMKIKILVNIFLVTAMVVFRLRVFKSDFGSCHLRGNVNFIHLKTKRELRPLPPEQ